MRVIHNLTANSVVKLMNVLFAPLLLSIALAQVVIQRVISLVICPSLSHFKHKWRVAYFKPNSNLTTNFRHKLLGILGLLVYGMYAGPTVAQSFDGRFEGQVDGQSTLVSMTSEGGAVRGSYVEGALEFLLEGSVKDAMLTGTLTEPNLGLKIAVFNGRLQGDVLDLMIDAHNPLSGERRSMHARLQRGGVIHPPATGHTGPLGSIDQQLVGTWQHEKLITSGGSGFASFTTVMTIVFGADGSVAQYTQSIGGGSNWSYGSGGKELQYQGRWYASNGQIYVQLAGAPEFAPAARYRFAGAYLVTNDANGQKNWKRP